MANNLTSNPKFIDKAGSITTPFNLRLIQWVDDNGDIAHDDTLIFILNGITMTIKIQPLADALGFGGTAWQAGPFNPGVPCSSFTFTSATHGVVYLWVE